MGKLTRYQIATIRKTALFVVGSILGLAQIAFLMYVMYVGVLSFSATYDNTASVVTPIPWGMLLLVFLSIPITLTILVYATFYESDTK